MCGCGRHPSQSRCYIQGHNRKGYPAWNKGIKTGILPKNAFQKGYQPSEEVKQKIIKANTGRKNPWSKRKNGLQGKKRIGEKNSPKMKEKWKDEKFRKERIKAILRGAHKRPTSYEKKIIDLCKLNNLPFKYVGDGQRVLGGKNPDFVETNGRKLIIETYARHWHEKDYEEKRAEVYACYGYKTLFLKNEDLNRNDWEEVCLNKINEIIRRMKL